MPKTNTHQRTTAVRFLLVRAKSRFHRLHPFPSARGIVAPRQTAWFKAPQTFSQAGPGRGAGIPPFSFFFLLRRGGGGKRGETHDDDGNGQDDDDNDSSTTKKREVGANRQRGLAPSRR